MKKSENLSEICEAEFSIFSRAINKMGFDPQGFAYMLLIDSKSMSENLIEDFNLTEEENKAIQNRIQLLT
jgi:hypothetical protein